MRIVDSVQKNKKLLDSGAVCKEAKLVFADDCVGYVTDNFAVDDAFKDE